MGAGPVQGDTRIRQEDRAKGRSASLAAGALLVAVAVVIAQSGGQQPVPNQVSPMPHSPFARALDGDPALIARHQKALNADRQKSMVADTDKLLKLARELNAEIGQGNRATLTPEELRKVADIEKLARNVRQKMSISYAVAVPIDESGPREMP